MDTFTASNGVTVREHDTSIGRRLSVRDDDPAITHGLPTAVYIDTYLDPRQVVALHELFEAERDEELGLWRSKGDPTWTAIRKGDVVYFSNADHERQFYIASDGRQLSGWADELRTVAREYLDAHPERKPWHEAKNGDAWVITWKGGEFAVVCDGTHFTWPFGSTQPIDDPGITAGRCIWTDGAS